MPRGENSCAMRSKSPGECLQPTPHFTTTASGMPCLRSNSAFDATCSPDHSTPIAVGLTANGKYAKGRQESPFACQCHSNEPHTKTTRRKNQQSPKHATPFVSVPIGLSSHKPREKKPTLRRFPVSTWR